MTHCTECGVELQDGAQFCKNCGHEVGSNASGIESTTGDDQSPVPTDSDDLGRKSSSQSLVERWGTGERIVLAGGALVVVSAFLPWITANILGTNASMRGIEGDGTITLLIGIIGAVAAGYTWKTWSKLVAGIAGFIVIAIAVLYIVDPLFGAQTTQMSAQQLDIARRAYTPSYGLYGTGLGGLLMLGGVVRGALI